MQEAPKATIYPKRGRFSNQRKAAEASFTLQTKKLLRTSFPSFCSDRRHPSPAHISARAPFHAGRRSSSPPRLPPPLPSTPAACSSSPPRGPTAPPPLRVGPFPEKKLTTTSFSGKQLLGPAGGASANRSFWKSSSSPKQGLCVFTSRLLNCMV